MNQAAQTTNNPVEPKPGDTPPKLWMILVGVFAAWLATLFIGYAASFETLSGGIFFIFLLGVPLPTFLFFQGRKVVSKRIVKALDYLTILTFATGLLAISEIDAKTLKDRAEQAAARIDRVQQDLQRELNSRLKKCKDVQIKPQDVPNIFSGDFLRSFLFCYELSDWQGIQLNQLSDAQVAKRTSLISFTLRYISRDDDTLQIYRPLADYDLARYEMRAQNPFSFSLPKSVAYLLVALAFAVRLTRTTLEVFEWHT
jgi:hypothetical protein